MATKRKAKAPAKAERVFVGWFPVAALTLTPKAAAAWLEDDAPQWSELIQLSLLRADREERRALANLALHVGDVTRAAALALSRGKPVELESMLDPREDASAGRVEPLALVLRAASRIDGEDETPDVFDAICRPLAAIASAMLRCARHADAEHEKQRKAEQRRRYEERMATDPAYRAYAESVARFRKAGDEAAALGRAAQKGAA
jgi:hypothetical protein